ncbi:13979_t:CDS:2 [Cetraspora pellucida]|uniref:13979_t:CDS:1 n=1 Tax=Cetraspora pellucida TaxID=1433469 RepID=A0ACA9MAR4_9GLOM|nr:13979_t:CDS:2 [Cetraspora pellucida]
MVSKKTSRNAPNITSDEIPDVILTDKTYENYCQYFKSGTLKPPVTDLSECFSNQSNQFHNEVRRINDDLKKTDGYNKDYFFTAARDYIRKNKKKKSKKELKPPNNIYQESFDSSTETLINQEILNSSTESLISQHEQALVIETQNLDDQCDLEISDDSALVIQNNSSQILNNQNRSTLSNLVNRIQNCPTSSHSLAYSDPTKSLVNEKSQSLAHPNPNLDENCLVTPNNRSQQQQAVIICTSSSRSYKKYIWVILLALLIFGYLIKKNYNTVGMYNEKLFEIIFEQIKLFANIKSSQELTLESENANLRERNAAHKLENADLRVKNTAYQEKILTLESENKDLKQRYKTFEEIHSNLKTKHAILKSKKKIKELDDKYTELQIILASLEKTHEALNIKYTDLLTKDEINIRGIEELENKIKDILDEKERVEAELVETIGDLRQQVKEKNQRIEELENEKLDRVVEQRKKNNCKNK